jgi:hypothetical protein
VRCASAMMAACARVGAKAPKAGGAGSLAAAMPGGGAGEVKDGLADECRAYIADFCGQLQRPDADPRFGS